MSANLKPLLHALEALDDTGSFLRKVRRDRCWREELPEDDDRDPRSYEEFGEAEQGYHGSDRR